MIQDGARQRARIHPLPAPDSRAANMPRNALRRLLERRFRSSIAIYGCSFRIPVETHLGPTRSTARKQPRSNGVRRRILAMPVNLLPASNPNGRSHFGGRLFNSTRAGPATFDVTYHEGPDGRYSRRLWHSPSDCPAPSCKRAPQSRRSRPLLFTHNED